MKGYYPRQHKVQWIKIKYKWLELEVLIHIEPAEPEIKVGEQVTVVKFEASQGEALDQFLWDRYDLDPIFQKEIDKLIKEAEW